MALELIKEGGGSRPVRLVLAGHRCRAGNECGHYELPYLAETGKGLVLSSGYLRFCSRHQGKKRGSAVFGGMQRILSEVARRSGREVIHLTHTDPGNRAAIRLNEKFGYLRIKDFEEPQPEEEGETWPVSRAQFKKIFSPADKPAKLTPKEELIVKTLLAKTKGAKEADKQVREFLASGK